MATRIAVFSDVHSNVHALDAVLAAIESYAPDAVYCLGDVVSGCAFPNECVDRLRTRSIAVVRGNHDEDVVHMRRTGVEPPNKTLNTAARYWTAGILGDEQADWLEQLPFSLTTEIEDLKFRFVHGSPRRISESIFPHISDARLRDIAKSAKFRVLCSGHTHYPFARIHKGRWYINSGTAGRPKTRTPLVNFTVVTVRRKEVVVGFPLVAYDVEAAARSILQTSLPPFFAEIIRRGIPVPRKEVPFL